MEFKAYKMDGLGNDFVIIDKRENEVNLSKEQIVKIGNRNNVGFDQIIFIEKKVDDAFPIKIYNPDGIEVGACGNGSRCVAYLIATENNQKFINLKANKTILKAEVLSQKNIKIDMGLAKFDKAEDIPLREGLNPRKVSIDFLEKEYGNGYCVNVGNPHIIYFVKDCEKVDIKNIGPKVENHHFFPERVNLTFAEILDDSENIKVNVWERGAGQTKACGTAACAVAVAGNINNYIKEKVDVEFELGKLSIYIDEKKNIHMKGPVSKIKEIDIKL